MYSTLILGITLLVVSFVAAEFTYGVPERVALDFGLGMLALSSVGIAIFMGVGLLSREIETRTVYMVLSRPVGRFSFLSGKILGMFAILAINILFLGITAVVLFLILGGHLSPLILYCILFSALEAAFCLMLVLLFSLLTNNTMSVIYTIALYIAGHAVTSSQLTRMAEKNSLLMYFLKFYSICFPNFSKINLREYVLYKQVLPAEFLLNAGLYGIVYILFLVMLTGLIFKHKNLD
jgi:ABC-type transport system involved in multi-copper enzyme maturation permease subunit